MRQAKPPAFQEPEHMAGNSKKTKTGIRNESEKKDDGRSSSEMKIMSRVSVDGGKENYMYPRPVVYIRRSSSRHPSYAGSL